MSTELYLYLCVALEVAEFRLQVLEFVSILMMRMTTTCPLKTQVILVVIVSCPDRSGICVTLLLCSSLFLIPYSILNFRYTSFPGHLFGVASPLPSKSIILCSKGLKWSDDLTFGTCYPICFLFCVHSRNCF